MIPYPQSYEMMLQNQLNQNYQQLQNMQQINQRTVIDRVQGEASADVYPVQPGQEVILLDIDNPYVYRKFRGLDNKLEKQRFLLVPDEKPEEPDKTEIDLSQYVKATDITQIVTEAVEKKMAEYNIRPTKRSKPTEEE